MRKFKELFAALPAWKKAVVAVATVGLIIIAIVPAVSSDSFLTNLSTDMALWAVLAVGLNAVLGWAGLLDLGYIAFFAIGGYTYAILSENHILQFWPSLIVGVVAAGIGALIIGFPSLRLDSDYLAIMTLGFGEIIYIAANNLSGLTGGVNGLYQFQPPSLFGLQIDTSNGFYVLALVLLIVCVVTTGIVRYSRLGLAWMSIRTDELSARSMGVAIWRTKLYAYLYGSVWGALAGAVFAAKQSIVSPTSFSLDQSFNVLSAVVIGGMGSVWGAAIGGIAYIVISESFQGVSGSLSGIVFGGAMLLVILLRPQGLVPIAAISGWLQAPFRGVGTARAGGPVRPAPPDQDIGAAPGRGGAGQRITLRAHSVRVVFGGLRAVDDASLECCSGTITALIGPNGAGKTTLLNALSGFVPVRSGTITITGPDGEHDITRLPAERRARIGMGRAFQIPRLDREQTTHENIRRGALASKAPRKLADAHTDHAIELVGLTALAHVKVGELSYGDQRRCEIARALVSRPRLLLLDEPSSGMNEVETTRLAKLIRAIAERGTGIVLVEHDMALVSEVAHQVVAMDAGRELVVGSAAEVLANATVRRRYLGEE